MHKHGFKGRKFDRNRDQREALFAGLSVAMIEHKSIKTTLSKAKELKPHMEKLITVAKKKTLASRRLVIARLDNNVSAGHKLTDEIIPQIMGKRTSGYLRIEKLGFRRGDNTQMAKISFVDEIAEIAPELPKPKKKTKTDKKVKAEVKKDK